MSPSPDLVSVIIPVYNDSANLDRCLEAIMHSDWPRFECLVVDDGSTDPQVATVVRQHGARYLRMDRRNGPAASRNAGAAVATGHVLFFTDADVLLHPDTISKAIAVLQSVPAVAAVIGSYDDQPTERSLLSRYRNLFHHFNHQIANEEASTFWTGCGAIRKPVFAALGGFDSRFNRPSIEDIEFGYRMHEGGQRIRLVKDMLCTHMKRWTFRDMVLTDIFQRGTPWVALLLQHPSVPRDLNLNWRAQLATLAAAVLPAWALFVVAWGQPAALLPVLALLLACGIASLLAVMEPHPDLRATWQSRFAVLLVSGLVLPVVLWVHTPWALAGLALVLLVTWTQWSFYGLLSRRGGYGFALAAVPLQLLFFLGCAMSVPLGWILALRHSRGKVT